MFYMCNISVVDRTFTATFMFTFYGLLFLFGIATYITFYSKVLHGQYYKFKSHAKENSSHCQVIHRHRLTFPRAIFVIILPGTKAIFRGRLSMGMVHKGSSCDRHSISESDLQRQYWVWSAKDSSCNRHSISVSDLWEEFRRPSSILEHKSYLWSAKIFLKIALRKKVLGRKSDLAIGPDKMSTRISLGNFKLFTDCLLAKTIHTTYWHF